MKLKDLFDSIENKTLKDLPESDLFPKYIEPFVYDPEKHFHILMEMTTSTGPTPNEILHTHDIPELENIQKYGKHIGDLDMFPVFHYQNEEDEYYGVVQDNKIVSYVYVTKDPRLEHFYGWHRAYTLNNYRNQQHIKRLLYFIKSKVGYRIYDASAKQSPLGIQLIQSIGRDKRFKVSWVNIKTREKVEFDPTIDHDEHHPYRTKEKDPTDWRILIESTGGCSRHHFFTTNKMAGNYYINSNSADVHNVGHDLTLNEMRNRLNFNFDHERRRKVI